MLTTSCWTCNPFRSLAEYTSFREVLISSSTSSPIPNTSSNASSSLACNTKQRICCGNINYNSLAQSLDFVGHITKLIHSFIKTVQNAILTLSTVTFIWCGEKKTTSLNFIKRIFQKEKHSKSKLSWMSHFFHLWQLVICTLTLCLPKGQYNRAQYLNQ